MQPRSISRRYSNRCNQFHPRRSFHCQSTLLCAASRPVGALVVLVAVQVSVLGLYLPPVLKISDCTKSSPDDHFTAAPDCGVIFSARGRVGGAGGCPTIRTGIVSAASVQPARAVKSAPDDHFTAAPDCGVRQSCQRARWWCWWLSKCPCLDRISRRY